MDDCLSPVARFAIEPPQVGFVRADGIVLAVSSPHPVPDAFDHRPGSQMYRPKLALAGTPWGDAVLMLF